ncbi:MAG: RNA polymerase sigma factor [Isosphaeraceae bacterium]
MASRPHGAVLHRVHQLFQLGSNAGLAEGQLLERFAQRQDESAFEAILARHGPMVLGVCRRVLGDGHAADDAFQATFLVLVRKARTLGPRDPVGNWLYGVACRVATRARCDAARRRAVEATVDGADAVSGSRPADASERGELAALLDAELSRLPEKYRAPVVLCYLEGLTHDEAATRLGWPVGSVKGRLARAREILRGRLTRRGVAPSTALLVAALSRDARAVVPEALRAATLQTFTSATATAGRLAVGMVPAAVASLSEGVISAMFATQIKTAAAVLACGCLAAGAWAYAQGGGGQGGQQTASSGPQQGSNSPGHEGPTAADYPEARERVVDEALAQRHSIQVQAEPLGNMLKTLKAAGPLRSVPVYVDPEGLKESGASVDTPVTLDVKNTPLREALDVALRPLKLGAANRKGLLVVTSRAEAGRIELRNLQERMDRLRSRFTPEELAPEPTTEATAGPTSNPETLSAAAWLKRLPGSKGTYIPGQDDADDARAVAKTQEILKKLNEPITMEFPQETPLEDVLNYIQKATQGPTDRGIPIYVDPRGLQEAEKTLTSPITLKLVGVPLRTSLRLLLKQLDLTYVVRDGLLTITSQTDEEAPTPLLQLAARAERGELSVAEMNDLVAMFKARDEVARWAGAKAETAAPQTTPAPIALSEEGRKSQAILKALERVVPLKAERAPLGQVVQEIQKKTLGAGLPEGIPVYVNPNGSNFPPTVTIDLKGAKLKTVLRLALTQSGMAYAVKDGLLVIDRIDSPELRGGERLLPDPPSGRGGFQ